MNLSRLRGQLLRTSPESRARWHRISEDKFFHRCRSSAAKSSLADSATRLLALHRGLPGSRECWLCEATHGQRPALLRRSLWLGHWYLLHRLFASGDSGCVARRALERKKVVRADSDFVGLISALTAFVTTPMQFYVARFFLAWPRQASFQVSSYTSRTGSDLRIRPGLSPDW